MQLEVLTMQTVVLQAMSAASVLVGLAGGAALGQEPVRPAADTRNRERNAVHKMVITNGDNQTVHYFGDNLSPSETDSLRELERAENQVTYTQQLQDLLRLYLSNERTLEPVRAVVQQRLYGTAITTNNGSFFNGSYGNGGFGYAFPYVGYGFNLGGGSFANSFGYSGNTQVMQNLAFGVGDEGIVKQTLVRALLSPVASDMAAGAARDYTGALTRVSESDRLASGLGLHGRGGIAPVGFARSRAVLTLKNGDKIEGALVREDPDWYVIDTGTDEVTVRKSDVTRVTKPKAGRPAPEK
jgi:hypothetical protein